MKILGVVGDPSSIGSNPGGLGGNLRSNVMEPSLRPIIAALSLRPIIATNHCSGLGRFCGGLAGIDSDAGGLGGYRGHPAGIGG